MLDGIASDLYIKEFGVTNYNIQVSDDTTVVLKMKSYYVPGIKKKRLSSPQGIQTNEGLRGSLEECCNESDPESFAILRFRKPSNPH